VGVVAPATSRVRGEEGVQVGEDGTVNMAGLCRWPDRPGVDCAASAGGECDDGRHMRCRRARATRLTTRPECNFGGISDVR